MSDDLKRIEDLIRDKLPNNNQENIAAMSSKMEDDHDDLILLGNDFKNFNKNYDENRQKEKSYGRAFSKDIKALEDKIKLFDDYLMKQKIKEEAAEKISSVEKIVSSKSDIFWSRVWKATPWIVAAIGGGTAAVN